MDAFYASVELRRRPGAARPAGDRRRRPARGGAVGDATRPARSGCAARCRCGRARRLCPQAVVAAAATSRDYAAASAGVMAVFRVGDAAGRAAVAGRGVPRRVRGAAGGSAGRPGSASGSAPGSPTSRASPARSGWRRRSSWPSWPRPGASRTGCWWCRPAACGTSCTRCRSARCGASASGPPSSCAGLGLRTVGDLAALPLPALRAGARRGRRRPPARAGLRAGTRARSSPTSRRSRSAPRRPSTPTWTTTTVIRRELLRLAEQTAARLRAAGQAGRTVSIKVRFADFSTVTRARTLPAPTDAGHEVYETARALYDGLELDRARIRLVGVRVEGIAAGRGRGPAAGARRPRARLAGRGPGGRPGVAPVRGSGAVRPATLVGPTTRNTGAGPLRTRPRPGRDRACRRLLRAALTCRERDRGDIGRGGRSPTFPRATSARILVVAAPCGRRHVVPRRLPAVAVAPVVRRGAVPLSDHEQRLLEQIERALYAEDPKFASTVSSTDLRTHARRRVRRAIVLLILGLGGAARRRDDQHDRARRRRFLPDAVRSGLRGLPVQEGRRPPRPAGRRQRRQGRRRAAASSGRRRCCSAWKSASAAASTTAELRDPPDARRTRAGRRCVCASKSAPASPAFRCRRDQPPRPAPEVSGRTGRRPHQGSAATAGVSGGGGQRRRRASAAAAGGYGAAEGLAEAAERGRRRLGPQRRPGPGRPHRRRRQQRRPPPPAPPGLAAQSVPHGPYRGRQVAVHPGPRRVPRPLLGQRDQPQPAASRRRPAPGPGLSRRASPRGRLGPRHRHPVVRGRARPPRPRPPARPPPRPPRPRPAAGAAGSTAARTPAPAGAGAPPARSPATSSRRGVISPRAPGPPPEEHPG